MEISFTCACPFLREPGLAQWGGCCCVTLRRPSNVSEPHWIMRIPTLQGCCGTQVQGMGNYFAGHKTQCLPKPVSPLEPRVICPPRALKVLTCLRPMYKTLKSLDPLPLLSCPCSSGLLENKSSTTMSALFLAICRPCEVGQGASWLLSPSGEALDIDM